MTSSGCLAFGQLRRFRRGCIGLTATALVALLQPVLRADNAPHSTEGAIDEAGSSQVVGDGSHFHQKIQPLLEAYCYGCHAYGASEGGRSFDTYESEEALFADTDLWWAVLKNVRAEIMPPPEELHPSSDERALLADWIKRDVFQIDPQNPDPGRVTLRRLNRVEYRNTIRDLTGVDFNTNKHFLPDDAGYGFDNIGDVLTISPLMLEKYLQAADAIMREAIPDESPEESPSYGRLFPEGPPPESPAERDQYAYALLDRFATRAYRRPVDETTIERLVEIAKSAYTDPDHSFESGIARAMMAVLASPRFLFRIEEPIESDEPYPLIDEYSLASRLSYFLWSTMPDDTLLRLAADGKLRANLGEQVTRMLDDRRSERLVENFVGQWLRSRDVPDFHIDREAVVGIRDITRAESARARAHEHFKRTTDREIRRLKRERDDLQKQAEEPDSQPQPDSHPASDSDSDANSSSSPDKTDEQERQLQIDKLNEQIAEIEAKHEAAEKEFKEAGELADSQLKELALARDAFDYDLRRAMQRETEAVFDYVMRNDRDLAELLDADYTFVNAPLARHYGIPNVEGDEMRRVSLPPDSPRGGILTQGTLLVVTSNPTRTSVVKRGLHILENMLGTPPPPPPPDIPALETAAQEIEGREPTSRELLEIHRRDPLCHSCHVRMDPLGMALENFDALGAWRDFEQDQAIDASGELPTGEHFTSIVELKQILAENYRVDFYRCLTEKLLTYALGRGLEYYDEHTIDQIVARLNATNGKFSTLLMGIVESAPFQRQRNVDEPSVD